MESKTQGSRPRPRTQKNPRPRPQKNPKPRTAFPRTDPLEAKDRNARGQGPRTQAQVFSEKKVFKIIFQAFSSKKRLLKSKFNYSKKKCCPRAEDRPIFEDLRPGGQGQGFDLRGRGLQSVSSRPRTSSQTPPLILSIPKWGGTSSR